MQQPTDAGERIHHLLGIMARLRTPGTGCPWDLEQDFSTIAPYTLEEAYEVVDAIDRNSPEDLREELGDLLFQVVFHARMAEEKGWFSFADVAQAITDKLVRRHPGIFGQDQVTTSEEQKEKWEEQKAAEKARKGGSGKTLDGVPLALPALTRAVKLQEKSARVGFEWRDISGIFAKLDEEIAELKEEVRKDAPPPDALSEEIGDILFVVSNIARNLKVDPETALRRAGQKFERRFGRVEELLAAQGKTPGDSTLEAMETLWQQVKAEERV
ncbi:MAG: nucleoside triphosphate pyrophosphohydrolase [Pseudomonadota bacterium]|nr:nucleoside triphosphate pyrophosphohydrolase [Pseudomonadota bacterium]